VADKARAKLGRRLAELLVVFLGVVLAFIADDYREQLEDDRAEQAAISGLVADFTANSSRLADRSTQYERLESSTSALSDLIESAPAGGSLPLPDTLLMAFAMGAGTYDAITATVDALLNSGELRLIKDRDLRVALAEWPALLDDLNETEQWSREVVDERALPLLLGSEVELARAFKYHVPWLNRQLPVEAGTWSTRVENSPQLRAILALHLHRLGLLRRRAGHVTNFQEGILGLLTAAAERQ
jgi:hypothetical protein